MNPEQLNNHQFQSVEQYDKSEPFLKELFGNVVDHIRERRDVHKSFIEYARQILTPTEQQQIIDMFGGKNLKGAINNFLKEKKKALQEAEPKKDGTGGDRSKLNQLNLTMLFLGNPSMNAILNAYYDDFISFRRDWSGSNKDLLDKYTLSKKTPEEIEKVRKNIIDNQKDLSTTNGTKSQEVIDQYSHYIQEETNLKSKNIKPQRSFPNIVSSGYQVSEKGTTLCSRTTAQDAKRLFHISLPLADAFTAMREEKGNYTKAIVSERYKQKEQMTQKIDSIHTNSDLGKSNYINTVSGGANFADLYVTSSTVKGKKYGHRAIMFSDSHGQRYVLDPYSAVQPGENKNKPRTLENYALSMKTGRNKREFMRMNFYNSSVDIK